MYIGFFIYTPLNTSIMPSPHLPSKRELPHLKNVTTSNRGIPLLRRGARRAGWLIQPIFNQRTRSFYTKANNVNHLKVEEHKAGVIWAV